MDRDALGVAWLDLLSHFKTPFDLGASERHALLHDT